MANEKFKVVFEMDDNRSSIYGPHREVIRVSEQDWHKVRDFMKTEKMI